MVIVNTHKIQGVKEVTMSERDRLRIDVISRVVAKQTTAKRAAEIQGVCLRQVRRQIRAFREKGVEGLIHGNRGRAPRDEFRRRCVSKCVSS